MARRGREQARRYKVVKKITVKIEGVTPLLFHSVQLANPLNEFTKKIAEITSKPARKRSDDDLVEKMRLEWYGGMNTDEKGVPAMPSEYLEAAIREGAKSQRKGKDSLIGVSCDKATYPLQYNGPRDLEAMWASQKFTDFRAVAIKTNKIMRMRPRFNPPWSVSFSILVDNCNPEDVRQWLEYAGAKVGIGDYRPKFGRFEVAEFKVKG